MNLDLLKNKILQVSSIEDFIADYVTLKHRGNTLQGLCPIKTERTPSFYVNAEKQYFKCFGCGAGGDIITFAREIEGLDYKDTLFFLAEYLKIDPREVLDMSPEELKQYNEQEARFIALQLIANIYNEQLELRIGQMMHLVENRGISEEMITKHKIGYCPEKVILREKHFSKQILEDLKIEWPNYAFFGGRIIFPFFNKSGKVIGFTGRAYEASTKSQAKYINSAESEFFHKSKFLYNLNNAIKHIKNTNHCYLVEGQVDAILMDQYGFSDVVAVSGTSFTSDHAQILMKMQVLSVTILFDGDKAGQKAMLKVIPMLLAENIGIDIVRLHPERDPADYLAHGQFLNEFQKELDEKVSFVEYFATIIESTSSLTSRHIQYDKLIKLLKHCKHDTFKSIAAQIIANICNIPVQLTISRLNQAN